MKNRYKIKKNYILLTFILLAELFLPNVSSGQGAIVGYGYGKKWIEELSTYPLTGFPTDEQLDRITNVIASDIGCNANGSLYIGKLPNTWEGGPPPSNTWNGSKNLWLVSLINRSHAKGVNVSICVGGDTLFFPTATNSINFNTFVTNIVSFVNVHGLDGVDIDWERPRDLTEWNQCIALLQALRTAMPLKRITIALPHSTWFYPPTVQQSILDTVHAIHLMTYDEGEWLNHSNTIKSIKAINRWINWGTPTCEQTRKLFLGCAFYGYKKDSNGNTLWGNSNKENYATYSGGGNYNSGDLPEDVSNKAMHCLINGYGGVFIWELGYDLPADHPQSLLKTIYDVKPSISGPSFVCSTNTTPFTLTEGSKTTWSRSSNLAYVSGDGTGSYTVKPATTSTSGNGWVEATVCSPCGNVTLPRKNVWVGKPTTPTANISTGIVMYTNEDIWLYLTSTPGATVSSGQWSTSGVVYSTAYGFFSADVPGTGTISVTTLNVCGTSPARNINVMVKDHNSMLTIAPNPASEEIYVSFDANDFDTTTENDIYSEVESNSIRIINNFGFVMYSGKLEDNKKNVNVSNWEKGLYHVYITNKNELYSKSFIVN